MIIANKLQVADKSTLYINSNYAGASVPVPQGVGPSTKMAGTRWPNRFFAQFHRNRRTWPLPDPVFRKIRTSSLGWPAT